jgi:hypothetical protein
MPQFDDTEGAETTELPYVLTNPVFQQFATLLTVFDYLQRPSPAPKVPYVMRSQVFGYPMSSANKAILKYFDDQVDSIGSIAAAHFGIPLPPLYAKDDYSDFWTKVDLGLRQTKITFPPDSQWIRQSPAWVEQEMDGSDVKLHMLFRIAVVGATVDITTQPSMTLTNAQDVRNARIALMKYHMRPTDSFDPQSASGQTQHPASPEPIVSAHSSEEEEELAADSARKPAPAARQKPAVKRKAATAAETDEQSGEEEEIDSAPTGILYPKISTHTVYIIPWVWLNPY